MRVQDTDDLAYKYFWFFVAHPLLKQRISVQSTSKYTIIMRNLRVLNSIFFSALFVLFLFCQSIIGQLHPEQSKETNLPKRPNILWLVTEDMGAYISPFGDHTVATPNLSRLAKEGVVYPNLFSTSGVCAPSRSAIITGMYPSGIGANHMRTTSNTKQTGLKSYEAVPPVAVKMVSELMRINGYYCTNNYKEDYQFRAPKTGWDESSAYAHWRNKRADQPFFSVFNFTETHESGLFEPYGHRHIETRHYRSGDTTYTWGPGRMTETQTPKHIAKNKKFKIPPYLPDTEVVRRDMWKLYNNIAEMDRQLGAVLKQLEEDNLLENTIIFFYGDHGGPLPREKRLIYDSGLNTPMIIRFPNKLHAGTTDNQLISFVDFAPTLLSLIGVKPLEYMQGQAFLGKFKAKNKREYIHAAADRFDEVTDVIRAVRDTQFKYIKNYRTDQAYYLPLGYRERIPTMQELLRMYKNNELNEVQKQWFRDHKPVEELFDCKKDPHELHNLATDPAYKDKLIGLRSELDRWLLHIGDQPELPEEKLIQKLWDDRPEKPLTANPEVKVDDNNVSISCATKGASIGYKILGVGQKERKSWDIYTKPIEIPKDCVVKIQAFRIGYRPSKIKTIRY